MTLAARTSRRFKSSMPCSSIRLYSSARSSPCPTKNGARCPKPSSPSKPGAQVTAEELKVFTRERIAAFKVPKHFEFCELRKTISGKIQNFLLRDREWGTRERRVN